MSISAKLFIDSGRIIYSTNDSGIKWDFNWRRSSNYTFLLNMYHTLKSLYKNIDTYMTVVSNPYYINSLTVKFEVPKEKEETYFTSLKEFIWQAKCGSDRIPINFNDQYSLYLKRFSYMSMLLNLPKIIPGLTFSLFAEDYQKYRSIVESLCYDWLEYADVQKLSEDNYIKTIKVKPDGLFGLLPYQLIKYEECFIIHKLCYIAYIKKGKILLKMVNKLINEICSGKSKYQTRTENNKYFIQYLKYKLPILGKLNKEFNPSLKIGLILNQLQYEDQQKIQVSNLFL